METDDDDSSSFCLLPESPRTQICAFLKVIIKYTSCFMVGCVLDCAKVMPSCAIGDSGTVQSSAVDIVGPQGGVDALGACSALFQGSF